ncbi:putative glycosidase-like protein [Hapsidospora chrysogenum ATCC 11550]|uniref:Putative glycosidase-like protein n=1 Tax=Hapsidospora chrysogenum (strain ATCC 11550 / CBS 779.69 / DSM 880 / IAM 14645 / JCM 23072 / IMI 49137) TaxID=857340 RepID=A0A086SYM5_HAPC1|nr:putative glycosidase-like protein [Hapsidospora chrysogenum ATCC 11550]
MHLNAARTAWWLLAATVPASPPPPPSSYHGGAGVLQHVNPLIGTRGFTPNDNGGMIPSVSLPFGMTRWTPQTRENFISQVPYSDHDRRMHGFQATHQPAIWMGENGQVVLTPGWGQVKPRFEKRGLAFRKKDERATPYVYEILLDADSAGDAGWNLTEQWASEELGGSCPPCPGGEAPVPDHVVEGANGRVTKRSLEGHLPGGVFGMSASNDSETAQGTYDRAIRVAMSAKAHVGHLRFDFEDDSGSEEERQQPYVFIQASRLNWTGHVEINPEAREVSGSNSQRQDYLLGPARPESFRGYFVSRFSDDFASYGLTKGGRLLNGTHLEGKDVGAFVQFDSSVERVEVRTGVSFVSVEQARRNLDFGIPDGTPLESTIEDAKKAWLEKLDRVSISGVNKTDDDHDPRTIFYTALFHGLQYPNDYSEPAGDGLTRYYSGYTDSVHEDTGPYYQSWSIWDTFRAEHSLLTIFAPEHVNPMMRSLLKIYEWSGRLPIWANMVETNIMIATNADAVLANALERGFTDFNVSRAWEAVRANAYDPPERDTELLYFDRQPSTPHEARAGLTSYMANGWVANDGWAESASRTLDYAFNDWAAAIVASHAGDKASARELLERSGNYRHLWNNETEFMQARNANGTWANETWGWTEGDNWVYTFDVMHDVGGLASFFSRGREGMRDKLDEHFAEGHNLHSNEPSHHVPYMYSQLGYPWRAAEEIRRLTWDDYNATAAGLRGNEDLGQMSAWYVFSALGFYPVNPAGDEYIVGTPLFDEVKIRLPAGPEGCAQREKVLVIRAPGAARGKMYVKGLTVDGREIKKPVLKHKDIVEANVIEFRMSRHKTSWGREGTI